MKKKWFYALVAILFLSVLVNLFGIVNTMVSLKYETVGQGDCISDISGDDLCAAIEVMQYLAASAFALACLLLVFRNKIIR